MRPRLVVLRALKLGDFLTGVPALRALADAFADHERVLLAPSWLHPLVDHVGVVHRLEPLDELGPVPPSLHGCDVAVDLHGRGPASQPVLLAAHPRRLIAFRHPGVAGTEGLPEWLPDEHEVSRWCRLLSESGVPADPTRLAVDPPGVASPSVAAAHGATLIHPGAASAARRWPPERFSAVARAEAAAGHPVVVTAGPGERDLAERVAAGAGLAPSVILQPGLLELLDVVAAADRVVSGDTGVAHVATAVGTPSVVICGPVSPALWGPPPGGGHVALWAGRSGDPHGAAPDPGLLRIGVQDVRRALDHLGPRRTTAART